MESPGTPRTSLPRIYVQRPRLLQELRKATEVRLTIVCGNAGYGKTCLMKEYLGAAGIAAEWYSLSSADRDVTRLADGLEACLLRLSNVAQPSVAPHRRTRRGQPSGALLSEHLLRLAFQSLHSPSLLVLDDYQNVDKEDEVNSLLGSLFENGPANLHFAVLSRSAPRFRLARLMAGQEVLTVGEDELAFTLEEVDVFLRGESGLELDDRAVALVHSRVEGWAAGVAMVAQSLRLGRENKVMAVLNDSAKSAWLAYDYLAEEVFDRAEPSVQDFLVRTAVLRIMTGPVCDHLLGTRGSLQRLLALENQGLFTASLDSSRESFRYHQLFRQFLRQKLHQRESQEAIQRLYARVAEYYEQREDWEECIHLYLQAEETLKAAELVERIGERFIVSGFSQTVEYWLRSLPERLTSTRPWLIALRGHLSRMAVNYEESLRCFDRALWLFQREGNRGGEAWVTGEIGYVKTRAGEIQQSLRYLETALELAGAGTMLRSRLLVNRAIALREAGMLDDSVATCTAASQELAAVADEVDRAWCFSRANRISAHAQMEMGDLQGALGIAREVLAYSLSHQVGEYEETYVLATLAAVLWALGEFDEAIAACRRALKLSGGNVQQIRDLTAHWLGNSLRDLGRYDEAEKEYAGNSREVPLERAYTMLLAGNLSAAKRSAEELHRRYSRSEDVTERSTAEIILAAVLRESGDREGALSRLRKGVHLLADHGFHLRLCSALLHQVRVEYELGLSAEGFASLSRALDLAATRGYYHFFWWDRHLVEFVCRRALSESLFPDYAVELAGRRLDSSSAPLFTPLLEHRRPDVRRQAQRLLSSLPRRDTLTVEAPLLAECPDQIVRRSLLRSIGEGVISQEGAQRLHDRYGLSWREVQILVEYYLRQANDHVSEIEQLRRSCAVRLCISENTVRCHVSNIRGKIGLPKSVSGRQVLAWACQDGIVPPPASQSSSPLVAQPE